MNNIYIVEMVINLEGHDDFCSDYTGEHIEIFENKFFTSKENAWNDINSRFTSEMNGNHKRFKFKGEYMSYDGGIYEGWNGYEEDIKINNEKMEMDLIIDCCGGKCTYRIRELVKGK